MYWHFIIQKKQWADWAIVFLCTLAGSLLIKYFYPWPAIINDSYDYLTMALALDGKGVFNPVRPFGYSQFLRAIGVFSHSTNAVVLVQGLCYACSLTLFLLAVKKYWPPKREGLFYLLEAVAALSPAALYLLNSVLSDPVFCCLVFLMLGMGIIMLKEQSWVALGVFLACFYAALFLRYSAEFFPLAFIPVMAIYGKKVFRIVSIALTIGVFCVFYVQMCNTMERTTGYRQLTTGFEGWQLANNAIHVLPYIPAPDKDGMPENEDVAFMHKYLYGQFDWYIRRATDNGTQPSADFMWDPEGPLPKVHAYCVEGYKMNPFAAWIDMGSHAFKEYAIWLILKHPKEFIWYYLWPNMKLAFFTDKPEAVFTYINVKAGDELVTGWFDFPKDRTMELRSEAVAHFIKPVLPWIELLTWLVFLAGAGFLFFRTDSPSRETLLVLLFLFLFGFIYYGTTVFASPVALRYWMPMHTLKLVFGWICFQKV